MDLLPILSTLRRHKTAAGLIIVEIALTSAIVCNALHMISQRIETLNHDSGLPENELDVLGVRSAGGQADVDEVTARDVAALRQLPGVKSGALLNQVIYGNNSSNSDVRKTADKTGPRVAASFYAGGEQAVATMGLRLIDGRDFEPQEYQASTAVD
jgi:putative ABC transport system permease protein